MNRVNMRQTESHRESGSYAARAELANLNRVIDELLDLKESGILNPTGSRQLKTSQTRRDELTAETN